VFAGDLKGFAVGNTQIVFNRRGIKTSIAETIAPDFERKFYNLYGKKILGKSGCAEGCERRNNDCECQNISWLRHIRIHSLPKKDLKLVKLLPIKEYIFTKVRPDFEVGERDFI
jgi:hypothetical protein